jgi:hypothetical protein
MPRRRTLRAIAAVAVGVLAASGLGCGTDSDKDKDRGIIDSVLSDDGANSATATLDKRIAAALATTRASPSEPAAWAQLARLRYQRAGIDGITDTGAFTPGGKAKLRLAAQAWERYVSLDPKHLDVRVARLMVQAYASSGLNEPVEAVRTMEIVTAAETPPSTSLYQQLAQLAYVAGETRTGDLAADRAVELAPRRDRKRLRAALDALAKQAAAQP